MANGTLIILFFIYGLQIRHTQSKLRFHSPFAFLFFCVFFSNARFSRTNWASVASSPLYHIGVNLCAVLGCPFLMFGTQTFFTLRIMSKFAPFLFRKSIQWFLNSTSRANFIAQVYGGIVAGFANVCNRWLRQINRRTIEPYTVIAKQAQSQIARRAQQSTNMFGRVVVVYNQLWRGLKADFALSILFPNHFIKLFYRKIIFTFQVVTTIVPICRFFLYTGISHFVKDTPLINVARAVRNLNLSSQPIFIVT